MFIIRVCVVAICAAIIFATSKLQASQKKTEPRKAALLVTKVVKLVCAALIAIAVIGQVVDLTSK